MRKKLIVLTTILGLIAFSGVAAAEEHGESENIGDTGDTTFNFGYDEGNGVFIWGSSASDGEFDCTLESESLEVTYANHADGGLLIEDLMHLEEGEGTTVEFPSNESDGSLEYDPANEDCQLNAGEVAGPQGQVNHGMFLKTFNAMFDGQARGCMVRHIAQSDLGKGDQQVNVDDVEETEETEDTEEAGDVTGTVEFETAMTDCVHGTDDDAEVEGESNGKGRPQWVTDMLAGKHGDDDTKDDDTGELESEDDDTGRRGPPDHARGKGPKG